MRATLSELELLRDLVREFNVNAVSSEVVRRAIDTDGHDPAVWLSLARDLGLTAIGVPVEYGGAGYSFSEVGVVLEELGRSLAPAPYLTSAALAPSALLACGDEEARRDLLPGIAAGTTAATVAMPEPGDAADAERDGDGYTLRGSLGFVMAAQDADVVLVTAALGPDRLLFAVESSAPGLSITRRDALDLTRPIWRVDLDGASARLVGGGDAAGGAGLDALAVAFSAALACEQAGGAARCLDMVVDYARTREQFGRPIGGFQAVKHRCADLLVAVEASRSIAYHARDLVAAGAWRAARTAASAAKAWCSDTYVSAAQECIQLHGGIGFTWEHDAHLHLRRARTGQLLGGSPRTHRRIVAEAMGL